MADQYPSDYRSTLSLLIKTSKDAQEKLGQAYELAQRLGRVDEAERLERLCGLAEGLEDGLRDITREVDGLFNPGRLTRLIVADVAVPKPCQSNQHTPAPKNPQRCLYCYAFPIERIEEDARTRKEIRANLGLAPSAEPGDDKPRKDLEDSHG